MYYFIHFFYIPAECSNVFLWVRGLVIPDRGVARSGGKRFSEGVDKGGTSVSRAMQLCPLHKCSAAT